MTGVGGLVFAAEGARSSPWRRLYAWYLHRRGRGGKPRRFLLLCFRRTGSNWVSGILFNHPEIMMHNEIFNENAVHSYYKEQLLARRWDYEGRHCDPAGFLRFVFDELYRQVDKFRDKPTTCKAIGYKSFPNHYLQKSVPLAAVSHEYHKLLRDPTVQKLILFRENVPKVYLSSRRSHEQGNYMTHRYSTEALEIDVAHMQTFVDRYEQCYEEYDRQLRGQWSFRLSYEELLQDPEKLRPALRYLGVASDLLPSALKESVVQSTGPISASVANYAEVEFAFRHTHLGTFLLFRKSDLVIREPAMNGKSQAGVQPYQWGLLVPVRSGKRCAAECEALICELRDSLLKTLKEGERPLLIFGVDDDDTIYLDDDSALLRRVFCDFPRHVERLPASEYRGAICKIWVELAAIAFERHSVDFTVLLHDDITLCTPGWNSIIECTFADIATERRLPFGAACVAFQDEAFKGFPTFPVVHRWHHTTFAGRLLPYQFVNQGGDPYLFELYKRFGAARFAEASLVNSIGGAGDARYMKQRLRFEDDILSDGIAIAKTALGGLKPLPVLDVVVPTYRCDLDAITRITQLRASCDASISFWIILDNPEHAKAQEVLNLQTVGENYQVNVRSQDRNYGASAARNFGLGNSKADWVVLIDDDVEPQAELLDAYLGATMRVPHASVLVGSTLMPPPQNWLTHAIVASDIPGAYTVADRVAEPPWGVTANLCVRGRSSRLRFDMRYPKTGGGEDLDFCAKARQHGPIIAVPGARAHHPWWHDGGWHAIGHILGWANGEVLCVGTSVMREHVFLTSPNGVELASLLLPLLLVTAANIATLRAVVLAFVLPLMIIACDLLWHASRIGSHRLREPMTNTLWRRICVRLCAAVLIILQEMARFRVALLSPTLLFRRVDWHFGQSTGFVARAKLNHALRTTVYVCLVLYMTLGEVKSMGSCRAPAYTGIFGAMIKDTPFP